MTRMDDVSRLEGQGELAKEFAKQEFDKVIKDIEEKEGMLVESVHELGGYTLADKSERADDEFSEKLAKLIKDMGNVVPDEYKMVVEDKSGTITDEE